MGKASSKWQAVLDYEQGSTHLKVKILFNKSSDDSDKVLKVPEMKKWRTTKNSNKDAGEVVEELEQLKEVKKKKVIGKKTKKKRKRSSDGRKKEERH